MGTILSIVAVTLMALAADPAPAAAEGRVPLPQPSKAFKGEKCVEPADVMRREHMVYLKHQRDETLREGIRGRKYSLRQCVECHATAEPEVGGGSVRTIKPFCGECHAYAAVRIDCFECHTGKAGETKTGATAIPGNEALKNMIAAHLGLGNVTGTPSANEEAQQ